VGHSIEGLLDDRLEAELRHEWRLLLDGGLPSQAHAGHHRPHVTLTWSQALGEDLEGPIGALAAGLPLAVRIGAVLCFPAGKGTFTLVRLVVPSAGLLELQESVAAIVADAPGLSRTSRPGAWTPHVTLAHRLSPVQVAHALALLAHPGPARHDHARPDLAHPGPAGAIAGLRHWDGGARHERPLGPGAPGG
jgi:hypothetical protein